MTLNFVETLESCGNLAITRLGQAVLFSHLSFIASLPCIAYIYF